MPQQSDKREAIHCVLGGGIADRETSSVIASVQGNRSPGNPSGGRDETRPRPLLEHSREIHQPVEMGGEEVI